MNAIVQQSPLPSRHAIRTLIEELIGHDIELTDGMPVPAKTTNVVAVYVTDRLATAALAVLDLEGAARIGGARGMLPRGGVQEAISERSLSGALRNNCYEVLNVMASVFNLPGAQQVRLYEMYGPDKAVPGDVAGLTAQTGRRMDVALRIAGYGNGMLSIVVR
jgi:cellulase/cellobiase CelA1